MSLPPIGDEQQPDDTFPQHPGGYVPPDKRLDRAASLDWQADLREKAADDSLEARRGRMMERRRAARAGKIDDLHRLRLTQDQLREELKKNAARERAKLGMRKSRALQKSNKIGSVTDPPPANHK